MRPSRQSITDLILHLHPRTVPLSTIRFSLSFGLGGMAVTLIGLLFLTGVLLLLAYEPTPGGAYASVQTLGREVPLGYWVRNIHHAGANLLVVVAVLHLLRVVLTGAFGPGRRLNWVIGLFLLFLVLAANFTGYLLPWDQLAYWAVTISTAMLGYIPLCGDWLRTFFRGGAEIGPATLANFHVLHVAVIPGCLLVLLVWHFWLVRKAHGLIGAPEGDQPVRRVPVVPDLVAREAAVGLGLIALVLLLALVWNAPLLAQANPGMSPNPTKAPWYFQGFQELLLHLHPLFAVFVWPLLAGVTLLLVPFLPDSALPGGVWFGSERGRELALAAALTGAGLALAVVLADNALAQAGAPLTDTLVTRGMVPTAAVLVLAAGAYWLVVRVLGCTRAEAVMAGLVLGFAALAALTVVGVWFRGAEMHLVAPWAQGAAAAGGLS
ncbi:Cytochrome b/b6 domain-containing protein [Pseudodesulfovibrio mercurii]|uniref:Cytochrome b/b6 domain-containing protein n=1 Tax=Pseudodesulfovibrio mercurii TaxID=641491 RepID=F0JGP1_9BACT|nr:cytochrome b N-terminal domain-containing protein [Pseudodesulfovibrio mercurii]EGB13910.1 Cytochrome b/b6 domain-containing protein [Pseudodesulfovibrio mercurii]